MSRRQIRYLRPCGKPGTAILSGKTLDLFNNPVGYWTVLAKGSAFCCFLAEVV
jgi:hypothetical protein